MECIIFENKEKIISQINECIKNDNLNCDVKFTMIKIIL